MPASGMEGRPQGGRTSELKGTIRAPLGISRVPVMGLGFRVSAFGVRVWGLELLVEGLGFLF